MGLDWPRQSLQRWPPSLVQSSFDWPAAQIQSQVWQQYLHVDSITNALLQATDIDHVEYRADLGSTKLEGKTFDKPVNFSQIKGSAMSNNALPMVCKVNLPAFLDELVQILWRQHPNLSDHQLWQEVLSGLLLWKNKHIPIAPKLTGTKTGALSSYVLTKQISKKWGEYKKYKEVSTQTGIVHCNANERICTTADSKTIWELPSRNSTKPITEFQPKLITISSRSLDWEWTFNQDENDKEVNEWLNGAVRILVWPFHSLQIFEHDHCLSLLHLTGRLGHLGGQMSSKVQQQ